MTTATLECPAIDTDLIPASSRSARNVAELINQLAQESGKAEPIPAGDAAAFRQLLTAAQLGRLVAFRASKGAESATVVFSVGDDGQTLTALARLVGTGPELPPPLAQESQPLPQDPLQGASVTPCYYDRDGLACAIVPIGRPELAWSPGRKNWRDRWTTSVAGRWYAYGQEDTIAAFTLASQTPLPPAPKPAPAEPVTQVWLDYNRDIDVGIIPLAYPHLAWSPSMQRWEDRTDSTYKGRWYTSGESILLRDKARAEGTPVPETMKKPMVTRCVVRKAGDGWNVETVSGRCWFSPLRKVWEHYSDLISASSENVLRAMSSYADRADADAALDGAARVPVGEPQYKTRVRIVKSRYDFSIVNDAGTHFYTSRWKRWYPGVESELHGLYESHADASKHYEDARKTAI